MTAHTVHLINIHHSGTQWNVQWIYTRFVYDNFSCGVCIAMLFPDWNSQYTTEHINLLQCIVICCSNYFLVTTDSAGSNDRKTVAAYIVMMKWLSPVTRTWVGNYIIPGITPTSSCRHMASILMNRQRNGHRNLQCGQCGPSWWLVKFYIAMMSRDGV